MLAENGTISDKQLQRMLILDWFVKGVLMLPALVGEFQIRNCFLYVTAGFLPVLLYAWLLSHTAKKMDCGFGRCVTERMGKWALKGISLIFLAHAFCNLLYLTCTFAEIGARFVLPETGKEILSVLMLLAGIIVAAGGLEVRARTASALYPFLVFPLVILLLAGACSINPEYLKPETGSAEPAIREAVETMVEEPAIREPVKTMAAEPAIREPVETMVEEPAIREPAETMATEPASLAAGEAGSAESACAKTTEMASGCYEGWKLAGSIFCIFGEAGMFLPLLTDGKRNHGKAFLRAAASVCAGLFAILLILTGVFGEGGLQKMDWPVIDLMSSAELPGFFVQRWDVIFVGLLLMELFLAAGMNLYYLDYYGKNIWNRGGKIPFFLWAILAFSGAVWCGSSLRAREIYLRAGGFLTAASVIFLLILCAVSAGRDANTGQRGQRAGTRRDANTGRSGRKADITSSAPEKLRIRRETTDPALRDNGGRRTGRMSIQMRMVSLLILGSVLLTGCAGRELEDRKFPTAVTFPDEDPWELQEKRQKESAEYLDYGQAKAVVVEDKAAENSKRMEEILEYLAGDPAFARNLLVFQGDKDVLALFDEERESVRPRSGEKESEEENLDAEKADGTYLEDLYKNQPKENRTEPVTLKDLLNGYYNGEPEIELPRLVLRDGKPLLDE